MSVPIIGQIPDYAFGLIFVLPDTIEARAAVTDAVAKQRAKIAKGDIAVLSGNRYRAFSLEEFEALIFPSDQQVDEIEKKNIIMP